MAIIDLVYPKLCAGCGREGKYICKECWREVGRGEVGVQGVGKLAGLVAPYRYRGVLQKALKQVKYKSAWGVVDELSKRWAREVARVMTGMNGSVVTSVPMYLPKARERGFDQAERLASLLAEELGTDCVTLLERVRRTKPQYGMNREEREKNVEGAFRFKGGGRVPRRVILVDDVWTTGSTMRECARILRGGGVEEVWGAVLAR